jgi:hypothetical protein
MHFRWRGFGESGAEFSLGAGSHMRHTRSDLCGTPTTRRHDCGLGEGSATYQLLCRCPRDLMRSPKHPKLRARASRFICVSETGRTPLIRRRALGGYRRGHQRLRTALQIKSGGIGESLRTIGIWVARRTMSNFVRYSSRCPGDRLPSPQLRRAAPRTKRRW